MLFASRRRHAFFTIFLLIIVIGAGTWIYRHGQQSANAANRQYLTATVKRGDIHYTIKASGSMRPFKTVKVGAQVSGEVSRLLVAVGDKVKKGDPIAEIEARTKENTRKKAVLDRSIYQAKLKTAHAEEIKCQKAYTRARTLYRKGAGSRKDMEEALAALNRARNAIEEAQANIAQSELTIKDSDVDLSHTKVTAPLSGTVISVAVEQGQTVNAAQNVPTLVEIAQTEMMILKAEIAEADVTQVHPGMAVTFTLLGKNSDRYHGTLKSIDPAPKEISDNEILAENDPIYYYGKIEVNNPDATLRYGMTAIASIVVNEAKDALLVPITALGEGEDGDTIVRVHDENGRVRSRKVKVGLENGINAEIKNGLTLGEKVIISETDTDHPSDSVGSS